MALSPRDDRPRPATAPGDPRPPCAPPRRGGGPDPRRRARIRRTGDSHGLRRACQAVPPGLDGGGRPGPSREGAGRLHRHRGGVPLAGRTSRGARSHPLRTSDGRPPRPPGSYAVAPRASRSTIEARSGGRRPARGHRPDCREGLRRGRQPPARGPFSRRRARQAARPPPAGAGLPFRAEMASLRPGPPERDGLRGPGRPGGPRAAGRALPPRRPAGPGRGHAAPGFGRRPRASRGEERAPCRHGGAGATPPLRAGPPAAAAGLVSRLLSIAR